MSELVPLGGGGLFRRESRAVGREVSRLNAQSRMEMARMDQAAELQAGRLQAISYVGRTALKESAVLSEMEHQLAEMVPLAGGRLRALADMTALAMADVVADTSRRIR